MAINYTLYLPSRSIILIIQVDSRSFLSWYHEDPFKSHDPCFRFIFIHRTNHYGPRLTRNPVPYQYYIRARYLVKTLSRPSNGIRTSGWPPIQESVR